METQITNIEEIKSGDAICEYAPNGQILRIYLVEETYPDTIPWFSCKTIQVLPGGFKIGYLHSSFLREDVVYSKAERKRFDALYKAIELVNLQLETYIKNS